MSDRKVTITVFDGSVADDGPPTNAIEFLEWLLAKVEAVPEEHRSSTEITFDVDRGYEGECSPELSITYLRPETDAERAARKDYEARVAESVEWRERDLLARLKAKFKE